MTSVKHINALIKELHKKELLDPGDVDDGYHTFSELYHHRNLLFVHLCKMGHETEKFKVWRSIKSAEGEMTKGWFILGIHKEEGKQLSYHLPIAFWNQTMFAETLEKAVWDEINTPIMIRLFDVENDQVKATEHCYTLTFLKDIMDNYPTSYLKIYAYLFYTTCPNPQLNPYFNYPEETKEESILTDIGADFSTEDELILKALERCRDMYETPTVRAYNGIKTMLDRLAKYMEDSPITAGRDGNINSLLRAAKDFQDIRESFKGVAKDLEEEQKGRLRGGRDKGYDG
jgi:hypothetical protein